MSDAEAELLRRRAAAAGCCGDDRWRGRFCTYHNGYHDGLDLSRELIDALEVERVRCRALTDAARTLVLYHDGDPNYRPEAVKAALDVLRAVVGEPT